MGRRDGVSHLSMQARAHCAVDKRWRFQTNRGWAAKIIIIYIYKKYKKEIKSETQHLGQQECPDGETGTRRVPVPSRLQQSLIPHS